MHFFCIFLQKYLVISKKSITFVADLEIVPSITKNNVKSMEKKVLCRFMIGGKVMKLVERTELGGRWSDYLIMEGRKRAEAARVYNDFGSAWDRFVTICENYVEYLIEGGSL